MTAQPNTTIEDELETAEIEFNRAMISNDRDQIARCVTDDWVLVTAERGPVPGAYILQLIGDGTLTHATMENQTLAVRHHGDGGTVTSRGKLTGTFNGAPIAADEWVTDVYVRRDGRWLCQVTHLSKVPPSTA